MNLLLKIGLLVLLPLLSNSYLPPGNESIHRAIQVDNIRKGKDFALFFAIDDYREWEDLRFPTTDVKKIAKDLEQHYGFDTQIVNNPTKRQIFQELENYRNKSYASDAQLLIFFSGHGAFTPKSREGFFVPSDGVVNDPFQESYLPHQRLESIVNSINCPHILLAIDACYSGTFDQSIAQRGPANDERPGAAEGQRERFIQRSLQYKSRLYLTSGGKERTPDKSQFAQQFLSALRNFGGQDGLLTFSELVVSLESARPLPRHGKFGDHQPGGNFLFVTQPSASDSKEAHNLVQKKADLKAWRQAKDKDTEAAYQHYLQEYPQGQFSDKATLAISQVRAKAAEELDWNVVKELDTPDAYQTFFDKYPESNFTRGTFRDSRDGQHYEWVRLVDGKKWMAENLNYATRNSYCYSDDPENCRAFGRLYALSELSKICPKGWRIPSLNDFNDMYLAYEKYFRNRVVADSIYFHTSKALIDKEESGFNAQKGGERDGQHKYMDLYKKGNYWLLKDAYPFIFAFVPDGIVMAKEGLTNSAFSCRCVQD